MASDNVTFFWPDTHIDHEHSRAVDNVLDALSDVEPDRLVLLGDFLDMYQPARWNKGSAAEFQPTLMGEIKAGRELLERIREVHKGEIVYLEGNHEARLRKYLHNYAPALSDIPALTIDALLDLADLEISYESQFIKVAPGVIATHGAPIANYAPGSATKLVKKLGVGVVQGHSHRLGHAWSRFGSQRLLAMECGHLCDMRKADYIMFGQADWQMGFGVLTETSTGAIQPDTVAITDKGTFVYGDVPYTRK